MSKTAKSGWFDRIPGDCNRLSKAGSFAFMPACLKRKNEAKAGFMLPAPILQMQCEQMLALDRMRVTLPIEISECLNLQPLIKQSPVSSFRTRFVLLDYVSKVIRRVKLNVLQVFRPARQGLLKLLKIQGHLENYLMPDLILR